MEAAKAAAAQLAAQLPPPDPVLAERIEKTAFGVAKNGPQFEAMLVAKQQGNPQFDFLKYGGSANGYYRHVLNCMANGGWTLEQVTQVRHQKLKESAAAPPQPPQSPAPPKALPLPGATAQGLPPPPSSLPSSLPVALSSGDESAFAICLAELNGSKESVEAGRSWVASQDCTVKGSGVGVALRRRAQQLASSGTTYHDHVLYVVYLVNDLLVKCEQQPGLKAGLAPQLPALLRCARTSAPGDEQRDKLSRVVTMWTSRAFFDDAINATLTAAANSDSPLPKPPSPSPFPLPPQHQQHQQQPLSFHPQPPSSQPPLQHLQQQHQQQPQMPFQPPSFQMHQQPPPFFGGPPPGGMPPGYGGPPPMLAPPPGYPQPPQQQQQQQPPPLYPPQPPHPAAVGGGGGGPMGLAFHLPSSSPASHGLVGGLGGGAGGGAVVPSLRSSGVAQLFPVAAGGNSLLQGGAFEDAPVGAIAGMLKVALGNGHKKYAPIPPSMLPNLNPPPVEPGRVQARVTEFYRTQAKEKAEQAARLEAKDLEAQELRDFDREFQRDGSSYGGGGSIGGGRDWDRDIRDRDSRDSQDSRGSSSRDYDSRSSRDYRDRDQDRGGRDSRRRSRSRSPPSGSRSSSRGLLPPPVHQQQPTVAASRDRSIDEDNLGYGMLKGMGWALGQGLGADQSGIAQPINDGGQTAFDKGGVGSRGSAEAPESLGDFYASYRNQLSSGYHKRAPGDPR